jgi:hypothetical protein
MRVWLTDDPNNGIWQTLKPVHMFGIFCAVLIMLLKVPIIYIEIALLVVSCIGLSALKKGGN